MKNYIEIIDSIKKRSDNSGLSLKQVAEGMNINVRTLKGYLSGKTKPRVRHIYMFCLVLNVSPNDLLGFDSES